MEDLKHKYRDEPWLPVLLESSSGAFLRYPHWLLKSEAGRELRPALLGTFRTVPP